MLNVIQFTLEAFARRYADSGFDATPQADFNDQVNALVDGTRDYLQMHYLANGREDTAYWRDVRDNPHMSDSLRQIIDAWDGEQSFDNTVGPMLDRHPYKRASWYCLLSGLGRYRDATRQPLRTSVKNHRRCKEACEQAVHKYHEHGPYLAELYGQRA